MNWMKIILGIMLLVLSTGSHAVSKDAFNVVYTAKGDFGFIRDSVAAAVEGKGLKINHFNKISEMLDNTGGAVGDTQKIYLNAEQMEFCSATLSRQMLGADPHSLVMCPYIISVYNLPTDPNTIYVSYRKLPLGSTPKSQAALRAVEKLFKSIIEEGIQ